MGYVTWFLDGKLKSGLEGAGKTYMEIRVTSISSMLVKGSLFLIFYFIIWLVI